MKSRWKTYDFWIGIACAFVAIAQTVCGQLELPHLQKITTALIGVLAVCGIVRKPPASVDPPDAGTDGGEIRPSEQQESE